MYPHFNQKRFEQLKELEAPILLLSKSAQLKFTVRLLAEIDARNLFLISALDDFKIYQN